MAVASLSKIHSAMNQVNDIQHKVALLSSLPTNLEVYYSRLHWVLRGEGLSLHLLDKQILNSEYCIQAIFSWDKSFFLMHFLRFVTN